MMRMRPATTELIFVRSAPPHIHLPSSPNRTPKPSSPTGPARAGSPDLCLRSCAGSLTQLRTGVPWLRRQPGEIKPDRHDPPTRSATTIRIESYDLTLAHLSARRPPLAQSHPQTKSPNRYLPPKPHWPSPHPASLPRCRNAVRRGTLVRRTRGAC